MPAGTLAGSVVGDWYLNSANGDYYEKTATTTWVLRGNLKGPQGPQGIQGVQGPQGATGATGTIPNATYFRLISPPAQAVSSGVALAVAWGAEYWDASNMWTSGPYAVINKAGLWLFGFTVEQPASGSGQRHAWLRRNGASSSGTYYGYTASDFSEPYLSGQSMISMAVNDWIEVMLFSTGSAFTTTTSGASEFWGVWIAPG